MATLAYDALGYVPPEEQPVQPPPEQAPVQQEAAPPPSGGTTLSYEQLGYTPPQQQAAPAATPVDQGPAPTYEAAPPPPPAAPGGPLSGLGGVAGQVGGALQQAGSAVMRGDPAGVAGALFGLSAQPQEAESSRQVQRAEAQDPLGAEEVLQDPSQVTALLPTTANAPSLIDPLIDPGTINPPPGTEPFFDALGSILTTPLPGSEHLPPPPTSTLIGGAANIIGTPLDTWLAENVEATAGMTDLEKYEAWKASGGASTAPPPEWINPLEQTGNPLQQIGGTLQDLPAFGGSVVESVRSGSIVPFGKSLGVDLLNDPLLPLEVLLPTVAGGLGGASTRLAATAATRAGTPVGRIAGVGSKLAGAGSRAAQLTNVAEQLIQLDPTALLDLGIPTKRGVMDPRRATDLSVEGQRQVQEQAVLTATGDYLTDVANTRAAGGPTSPYPVAPPAAVTPGVAPASPNGSAAPSLVPNQPVAGAPSPYQPVPPGQVPPLRSTTRAAPVSPTTGATLTPEVRTSTVTAAQKHLRQLGLSDVNVDVVQRLTDISPAARATDMALWRGRERLIALSADAVDEAPRFLDHEAIHALRDSGVFQAPEWETLLRTAMETPEIRQRVESLYPDVMATNPERFGQEMVADLYTTYRANPSMFPAETRSLLDRLVTFLKGLGGAVRETTPAEVLRRIDNGEVGRRSRQQMTDQADAAARVYHGSSTQGLTTLRADISPEERVRQNAASTLGVFTTPSRVSAESYTFGNRAVDPRTGRVAPGAVYTADVELANPYVMDWQDFRPFISEGAEMQQLAQEFKTKLIGQGHDGIHVMRGGDIEEIVSFNDVPVTAEDAFARRMADAGVPTDLPPPEDAFARIRVFHGSPHTDLTTISADPPSRQHRTGSALLGAFTTGNRSVAEEYARATGRVYQADLELANPYHMPLADLVRNFEWEDELARNNALEFKADLQAKGHGGIIAWDGEPALLPDGTPDPSQVERMAEIVSFYDIEDAFARRSPEPKGEYDPTPYRDALQKAAPYTTDPELAQFPEFQGSRIPLDGIYDAYGDAATLDRVSRAATQHPGYVDWINAAYEDRTQGISSLPVSRVPLNPDEATLIASQPSATAETLNHVLHHPETITRSDMPVVLKDGTTYIVRDGHHRVAAARINGDESVPAFVFDVNEGLSLGENVGPDDTFARRQPGPQNREESLTALNISGAARETMRRLTDPNATVGYHGHLLAPNTTAAMETVFPDGFHFNDGARVKGKELGEIAEQTYDELLTYIDMVRDPVLQQADPAEFERLTKKFVRADAPADFAAMGGPGNLEQKSQLTVNYANGIVAEAIHKAMPKVAKDTGLIATATKPLAEFTRVRAQTQLFNVANIPRYFSQNWGGNLLMTAARTPGAVPAYLRRLRDLRTTVGTVKGSGTDMYDDVLRQAGIAVIPTVDMVDKAQLGNMARGKLPPPKTKLEALARKTMNTEATAWAQTGDFAQRRAVAETVLEDGFRVLNANLPRIVAQNADGLNPVLPYRHGDYQRVVREFLATKSTRVDGNTGKMHSTAFGRPAKYTPVYTPKEFQTALRDGLLAIDPNVDRRSLNTAVHGAWQDVELSRQILMEKVKREVNDAAYAWLPTNLSEAMSKVVMFPYWTTKAGIAYSKFMLTHPVAGATYGRMMESLEEQAEVLGTPEWMKTYFRILNSPMGMTVWLNPLELLTTFLTFPEFMEGTSPDYLDLSALGQGASDIPFMLHPLLSLGIYATGAGGSDYKAPDVLGLNRLTGSAGALLNAANAHGLLPGPMGKDAAGNPVPINTRPLEELTARFGHALSTQLQGITGWAPVPVPNMTGGNERDVALYVEQDQRRANPELEQDEINRRVTAILADPDSPEYQHALQTMTQQALTLGGIDTPLPDGMDAALEAVLRINSPIGVHAGPEQLMLDSRAPGMLPSGETPKRNIPNLGSSDEALAKDAEGIYNDAKYGASRTVAARQFGETVSTYWDGRDPDNLSETNSTYWNIVNYEDDPTRLTEPVTIGGVTWTGEDLLALPVNQRYDLADQYASEMGTDRATLDAFKDNRDIYDDEARQNDPFLGGYLDFRNAANYESGLKPEEYIQRTMMVNPAYGEWVMENGLEDDGSIDVGSALSSDAYLALNGVPPSVYSPVHDVAVSGPGGPVAPVVTPSAAAAPPTVMPTADLKLRTGPDQTYESLATLAPGTSLTVTDTKGEWTQVSVPGTDYAGWVATAYLQNGYSPNGLNGAAPAPVMGGLPDALGGAVQGAVGAVGSLIDAAGAVVGSMFGAPVAPSKPAETSAMATIPYDVVTANDGMGVQSTIASDRTWMEDMIGPGHARVNVDYKGPKPPNVSYDYQIGHGADNTTHAAYDIGCDDPSGNCEGTPMFVPIAGKVVCAGYGQGTGEAIGSPACTYSQNTTWPGMAHTIVIDVGTDAAGNPLQLSLSHMGTSNVTPGQMVNVGDPLGTMGNTDGGPHTHVEAWGMCPKTGTYVILDAQLLRGGYFQQNPVC